MFNIIIIMVDDQGWGDFSLYGNVNFSILNIDSLVVNGVQFDWFFVDLVCFLIWAVLFIG